MTAAIVAGESEPQQAAMTAEAPRQLAVITDANGYQGLIAAFRARAEQLQIAISGDVNALAGLPQNYLGKLMAPSQPRRIGALSLGPVLGVLGIKLVIVEDEEALRRLNGRLEKRQQPFVRTGTMEWRISRRAFRKMQAKGRQARWDAMTPAQRSAWARKLNRIRWHPEAVNGAGTE
jgi:hypothetical protein